MLRRTFIGALSAGALLMTRGSLLKGADAPEGEVVKNVIRRQPYYFTVADKKFRTGKGDVAFLGGSITEMDGYRPMICEYLKKKYLLKHLCLLKNQLHKTHFLKDLHCFQC